MEKLSQNTEEELLNKRVAGHLHPRFKTIIFPLYNSYAIYGLCCIAD
jgi:hypothetical protein